MTIILRHLSLRLGRNIIFNSYNIILNNSRSVSWLQFGEDIGNICRFSQPVSAQIYRQWKCYSQFLLQYGNFEQTARGKRRRDPSHLLSKKRTAQCESCELVNYLLQIAIQDGALLYLKNHAHAHPPLRANGSSEFRTYADEFGMKALQLSSDNNSPLERATHGPKRYVSFFMFIVSLENVHLYLVLISPTLSLA